MKMNKCSNLLHKMTKNEQNFELTIGNLLQENDQNEQIFKINYIKMHKCSNLLPKNDQKVKFTVFN